MTEAWHERDLGQDSGWSRDRSV